MSKHQDLQELYSEDPDKFWKTARHRSEWEISLIAARVSLNRQSWDKIAYTSNLSRGTISGTLSKLEKQYKDRDKSCAARVAWGRNLAIVPTRRESETAVDAYKTDKRTIAAIQNGVLRRKMLMFVAYVPSSIHTEVRYKKDEILRCFQVYLSGSAPRITRGSEYHQTLGCVTPGLLKPEASMLAMTVLNEDEDCGPAARAAQCLMWDPGFECVPDILNKFMASQVKLYSGAARSVDTPINVPQHIVPYVGGQKQLDQLSIPWD